jgi:hypothetical protein
LNPKSPCLLSLIPNSSISLTNELIFPIQSIGKYQGPECHVSNVVIELNTNHFDSPTNCQMTSDKDKPRVPARRLPDDAHIRPDTDIQEVMGFLPKTITIEKDEKIPIAMEEGYDPMAIELALKPEASSTVDKLRMLILVIVAAVLVIILFPLNRFFKPAPRDLGPMSIGGPILEESLKRADDRNTQWLNVLVKMDNLYFREGKLTEAIGVAEAALGKIPEKDWETWKNVFYRYWELLSGAGRVHVLKTSAGTFLNLFPEDPFANYYYARAFLTAADRIRIFSPETTAAFRQEAEAVAQQIEKACSALDAQRKHPDTKKSTIAALADLYQKLRLEQADLYVLIWKLGGYEEDEHPDVIYRDKALDITESEELSTRREAKALKAIIYTHILDRWHWYEGQQIIQRRKQKRKDLQKQLDKLNRELKETEKL